MANLLRAAAAEVERLRRGLTTVRHSRLRRVTILFSRIQGEEVSPPNN